MISVDADGKVSVREPNFPIVAVSRGKVVIVAKNEKFKVVDHDVFKVSAIADAILVSSTLKEDHKDDGEDSDCSKDTLGNGTVEKIFIALNIWQFEVFLQCEV